MTNPAPFADLKYVTTHRSGKLVFQLNDMTGVDWNELGGDESLSSLCDRCCRNFGFEHVGRDLFDGPRHFVLTPPETCSAKLSQFKQTLTWDILFLEEEF